ncbi:uncharacterized protein SRS1_16311 [Sporisorium reilianum f. sp. reilianum]|uniref:TFIIB-type domain-containing protein n=1 Tax=Sporisorium reilianum f. sp. reilianum TaxID=72559 RepID=A0A2N8UL90_9BASI|nr:uncharacterized protein SRS1_16311 [Sporisorium reilianum f. sp. reilianum]
MELQVCPDCGSSGTVQFIAEIGEKVCSNCATVSPDLQIYEPTNVHEVAYALGAPQSYQASSSFPLAPAASSGRHFWHNDREHHRRLNDLQRKPEVNARIKGTLGILGYPGLFEQVEFLFRRARDESWTRLPESTSIDDEAKEEHDLPSKLLPPSLVAPRVKWGSGSLLLATACCYAVLRREGVRIDLATVADAAQLPFPKVRTAFRRLHLLVKGAVRNIKLAHPDAYVHRILAFFYYNLVHKNASALGPAVIKFLKPLQHALPSAARLSHADAARIFRDTPFEAVEATALDLCAFWWPNRISKPSSLAQLAAFAIVVFALEAHIKAAAPVRHIFRYPHAALDFDLDLVRSGRASAQHLGSTQAYFNKNAAEYYKELCAALKTQATKIPWLSHAAPITKTPRSKRRSDAVAHTDTGSDAASWDLARVDVIVHALDILDVWRTVASRQPVAERSDFKQDPVQTAAASSATTPPSHNAVDPEFSEDDQWEGAMDDDDMDCFVSASSLSAAFGVGRESPAQKPLEAAVPPDSNDEEVWPRVQQRLEAAGAVSKKNVDDHRPADHPIDLLTDDQVDRLLFDADELASLFRTDPVELAAFERAKVAAGEWTLQSDHQRNAEIAALARSLEDESAPARTVKAARSDSTTVDAAPASASTTNKRRKKRSSPSLAPSSSPSSAAAAAQTKPPSTTRSSKRRRTPASAAAANTTVSLREQHEESDWSE